MIFNLSIISSIVEAFPSKHLLFLSFHKFHTFLQGFNTPSLGRMTATFFFPLEEPAVIFHAAKRSITDCQKNQAKSNHESIDFHSTRTTL